MSWSQLAAGVALGLTIGVLSYRAGALTRSGAATAAVVGAATFGIGGLAPSVMLLTFFISSSALSRVGSRRKAAIAHRIDKTGPRDHAQVLANGAIPSLLAVAAGWTGEPVLGFGIAGALAASNSDTWATELGMLGGVRPRLITTLERVPSGTSGAVSLAGSLAAVAGAALVGASAWVVGLDPAVLLAATAAGTVASFVDSLLGATLQARYRCPNCAKPTERHPIHHCGGKTVQIGGWRWLGNDQVNLIASMTGALLGAAAWQAIF